MGHRYSTSCPAEVEIENIEKDILVESTEEIEDNNCSPSEEYMYVLVHNGQLKCYIQDETLLDTKIQYYMRQVFQPYISRWDAFNFNVVTQEGICCPESGVVKRIRLMSRSRYLLGLHEQIEEEIDIYRIPSLSTTVQDEPEESSESSESSEEEGEEIEEEHKEESS